MKEAQRKSDTLQSEIRELTLRLHAREQNTLRLEMCLEMQGCRPVMSHPSGPLPCTEVGSPDPPCTALQVELPDIGLCSFIEVDSVHSWMHLRFHSNVLGLCLFAVASTGILSSSDFLSCLLRSVFKPYARASYFQECILTCLCPAGAVKAWVWDPEPDLAPPLHTIQQHWRAHL